MKLAFCIIAHRVTPSLDLLIDTLSQDRDFAIYLHVDSASDIEPFNKYSGRAYLMKDRRRTAWASFNLVLAFIDMARKAVAESADHIFLLSNDDLPIQNNAALKSFMETRLNRQFIGVKGSSEERIKYRYPSVFYRKKTTVSERMVKQGFRILTKFNLFRNPAYKGIHQANKGCAWCSISRDFARYIIDGLDSERIDKSLYEHALFPDESFFQNAVLNSDYSATLDHMDGDDNRAALRYIDWKTGPDYPRILDRSDFKRIKDSGILFCRKVKDSDVDAYANYFGLR
jgi:hypothetical protein